MTVPKFLWHKFSLNTHTGHIIPGTYGQAQNWSRDSRNLSRGLSLFSERAYTFFEDEGVPFYSNSKVEIHGAYTFSIPLSSIQARGKEGHNGEATFAPSSKNTKVESKVFNLINLECSSCS